MDTFKGCCLVKFHFQLLHLDRFPDMLYPPLCVLTADYLYGTVSGGAERFISTQLKLYWQVSRTDGRSAHECASTPLLVKGVRSSPHQSGLLSDTWLLKNLYNEPTWVKVCVSVLTVDLTLNKVQ